jgi:hypothetical protein
MTDSAVSADPVGRSRRAAGADIETIVVDVRQAWETARP